MTVDEYLEKHNLDCGDVIFMNEEGREIRSLGCLILHCQVLNVDGVVVTVR